MSQRKEGKRSHGGEGGWPDIVVGLGKVTPPSGWREVTLLTDHWPGAWIVTTLEDKGTCRTTHHSLSPWVFTLGSFNGPNPPAPSLGLGAAVGLTWPPSGEGRCGCVSLQQLHQWWARRGRQGPASYLPWTGTHSTQAASQP